MKLEADGTGDLGGVGDLDGTRDQGRRWGLGHPTEHNVQHVYKNVI